jgi:hypothetical protein
MIIYISGPITGIKNNNRDTFYGMETLIENYMNRIKDVAPYEIINPIRIACEVNNEKRFDQFPPKWEDYMRACIKELCRATAIIFLPGSEKSKGAKLEKMIAEKLGIREYKFIDNILCCLGGKKDDGSQYQHGER